MDRGPTADFLLPRKHQGRLCLPLLIDGTRSPSAPTISGANARIAKRRGVSPSRSGKRGI